MAKSFGSESEYSKAIIALDIVAYTFYSGCLAWGLWGMISKNIPLFSKWTGWVAFFIVAGFFSIIVAGLILEAYYEAKHHKKGIKGEILVNNELLKLPFNYSVFWDVHQSFGNIDFVVIGPNGIYTIEAKNLSGFLNFKNKHLTLNNKKTNYLSQARGEAKNVHDFLNEKNIKVPWVIPIVVFSGYVKIPFGFHAQDQVYVIQKSWIKKLMDHFKMSPQINWKNIDRTAVEKILKQKLNSVPRPNL